MVSNQNLEEIAKVGLFERLSWECKKSAGAPWENGYSEALIRLVKKPPGRISCDYVLSYSESQMVMFDTANLLNVRPIGYKKVSDADSNSFLHPNDLLLGHSTVTAPTALLDES